MNSCREQFTVFAQIEARVSIYFESTLIYETGLYSRPAFIVLNRVMIEEIEEKLGAEYNLPVNWLQLGQFNCKFLLTFTHFT